MKEMNQHWRDHQHRRGLQNEKGEAHTRSQSKWRTDISDDRRFFNNFKGKVSRDELTTIFVDNLPEKMNKLWLRSIYAWFGDVAEVFIPSKNRKFSNTRFGFVRFFRLEEALFAIEKTNNAWCLDSRLHVHRAESEYVNKVVAIVADHEASIDSNNETEVLAPEVVKRRDKGKMHTDENLDSRTATAKVFPFAQEWRKVKNGNKCALDRTFLDAVIGVGLASPSTQPEIGDATAKPSHKKNDILIDIDESNLELLHSSLIGWVNSESSILTLEEHFRSKGVSNIKIRPVGGKVVLLSFPTKEEALRLLIDGISPPERWFEKVEAWHPDFVSKGRFAWLSCEGLPLQGWSVQNFKKIGEVWGTFISVDDHTIAKRILVGGRVLISTDDPSTINQSIMVKVNGMSFRVTVREEVELSAYKFLSPRHLAKTAECIPSILVTSSSSSADFIASPGDLKLISDNILSQEQGKTNSHSSDDVVCDSLELVAHSRSVNLINDEDTLHREVVSQPVLPIMAALDCVKKGNDATNIDEALYEVGFPLEMNNCNLGLKAPLVLSSKCPIATGLTSGQEVSQNNNPSVLPIMAALDCVKKGNDATNIDDVSNEVGFPLERNNCNLGLKAPLALSSICPIATGPISGCPIATGPISGQEVSLNNNSFSGKKLGLQVVVFEPNRIEPIQPVCSTGSHLGLSHSKNISNKNGDLETLEDEELGDFVSSKVEQSSDEADKDADRFNDILSEWKWCHQSKNRKNQSGGKKKRRKNLADLAHPLYGLRFGKGKGKSSSSKAKRKCPAESSISDGGIISRNRILKESGQFSVQKLQIEAEEVWNLGQELGADFTGNKNLVIERIIESEKCDRLLFEAGQ